MDNMYTIDDAVVRRYIVSCKRGHEEIVEERKHSGTGGRIPPTEGMLCQICLIEDYGVTVRTEGAG